MTPKKPAPARAPKPTSFGTVGDFRAWLEINHKIVTELSLRCFKNHARARGIGYVDALDEALAFGWIDGVRRRLDDDSYTVRFTPRRPRSKWSAVNVRRVTQLKAQGRMHASGLAAFDARGNARPIEYSYETRSRELDRAFVRSFKANTKAWRFYQSQAPWYRRVTAFWVMSAKRPETRERRFGVLIDCSARNERIPGVKPAAEQTAAQRRR
jgi:uncharacterized protein YdeI (YjbR/CyaY-like superfamily)